MRQQTLTGYVIHQRRYQENRALLYVLSQEFGLIHGVGKKNQPIFTQVTLIANGKRSLKTFTQIHYLDVMPSFTSIQYRYAGMYINELLWHVLSREERNNHIYIAYQHTILSLQKLETYQTDKMSLLLRQFESVLLNEIGYGIDFYRDDQGRLIHSDIKYYYEPLQGFVRVDQSGQSESQREMSVDGNAIIDAQQDINQSHLIWLNKVHRSVIDTILEGKPLHTRKLWQQLRQFNNTV